MVPLQDDSIATPAPKVRVQEQSVSESMTKITEQETAVTKKDFFENVSSLTLENMLPYQTPYVENKLSFFGYFMFFPQDKFCFICGEFHGEDCYLGTESQWVNSQREDRQPTLVYKRLSSNDKELPRPKVIVTPLSKFSTTFTIPSDGQHCQSCCRFSEVTGDELNLVSVILGTLSGRMYSSVLKRTTKKTATDAAVLLCPECLRYHHVDPKQKKNRWADAWPSVFWSLIQRFEDERGWQWIPERWRHWWFEQAKRANNNLKYISIGSPTPFFKDRTKDLLSFKIATSNKADPIGYVRALNKFPYACVRCPWGCKCFLEECGQLSYVHPMVLFLFDTPECIGLEKDQHESVGISQKEKSFTSMNGICPDWLEEKSLVSVPGKETCWRISPSLVVDDSSGPSVLTCKAHDRGSELFVVHTPNNPFVGALPSLYPPQLSPCTIIPRVVHPAKPGFAACTFQMYKILGSFAGLSSFSATTLRRYDIGSSLLHLGEAAALLHRNDVLPLLEDDLRSGKVTREVAAEIYRRAESLNAVVSKSLIRSSLMHSNFQSAYDVLKLRQAMSKEQVIQLKNATIKKIPAPWPFELRPPQVCDQFGNSLRRFGIPAGSANRLQLLLLLSLVDLFPEIYSAVADPQHVFAVDDWKGFFLTYVRKHFFGRSGKRTRKNPFSFRLTDKKMSDVLNFDDDEPPQSWFSFLNLPPLIVSPFERTSKKIHFEKVVDFLCNQDIAPKVLIFHQNSLTHKAVLPGVIGQNQRTYELCFFTLHRGDNEFVFCYRRGSPHFSKWSVANENLFSQHVQEDYPFFCKKWV